MSTCGRARRHTYLKNRTPKTNEEVESGNRLAESPTVEASAQVICPFCGQSFELVIDTGISEQTFTTDCEICCRPFEVQVECAPGEVLSVSTKES
jgi:hypothetical protein